MSWFEETSFADQLPSERLRLAQEAFDRGSTPDRAAILAAMQDEPVAQIRAALLRALRAIDTTEPTSSEEPSDTGDDNDLRDRLAEMGAIIAHELRPRVGYVGFAAAREITEFRESRTAANIDKLSGRLEAVIRLTQAQGAADIADADLATIVQGMVPEDEAITIVIADEPDPTVGSIIRTDADLVGMIVSCALRNAIDAASAAGESSVHVAVQVSATGFQVIVTNRFVGTSFELADVRPAGRTTKANHKGVGLRIIGFASRTLGYEWSLGGAGGVATFAVWGPRSVSQS